MGNTRVMAAVFGPRPADRRGDESHDRATVRCEFIQAPFATGERRKRGKGDRRAVETASLVKDTLEATVLTELHPRSVIDVHVLVVQADGGVRACCINAVSLAVADAGIACRDVAAAVGGGLLDGTPAVDLGGAEDSVGAPEVTVALHPGEGKVVSMTTDNKMALESVEEALSLAVEGCRAVAQAMSAALRRHTGRKALAAGAIKLGGV